MQISHESIYRFAYHLVSANKDFSWTGMFARRKSRRGRPCRLSRSSVDTIKYRVSIHDRPASVASRKAFGHWETDLMAFAQNKQNILVMIERKSRRIIARKLPNKKSEILYEHLHISLKHIPAKLRRSITYDNGTKFALHHKVNEALNMKSYFCDTHSPWQKGGVENVIGRLRKPLPQGTNLAAISQDRLDSIVQKKRHAPKMPRLLDPKRSLGQSSQIFNRCTSNVTPSSRFRGND
jgi:transposase, IS30 family